MCFRLDAMRGCARQAVTDVWGAARAQGPASPCSPWMPQQLVQFSRLCVWTAEGALAMGSDFLADVRSARCCGIIPTRTARHEACHTKIT